MQIERLTKIDLLNLNELQPPNWSDILIPHRFYLSSNFCKSFKLIIENKIIGLGTYIIHHDVAWLAQIIVHPNHRNKNYGKYITQYLLDQLKDYKTIYLIATELGEPLYKKLGFLIETEYLFFNQCILNNSKIDMGNIKPFHDSYTNDLLSLDKEITGEDRSEHLLGFMRDAYVVYNGNNLEGYYLPDFGDGHIVAINSEAGIALINKRLHTHNESAFPIENFLAYNFMIKNSFHEYRRAKRMYLGEKRENKLSFIYNRVSGQIG